MTGEIGKERRVRPLAVPSPLLHQLRRQRALEHLDDVLAEDGEELEAVEVAARRDVEAARGRVGGDDEVGAGREGVPVR